MAQHGRVPKVYCPDSGCTEGPDGGPKLMFRTGVRVHLIQRHGWTREDAHALDVAAELEPVWPEGDYRNAPAPAPAPKTPATKTSATKTSATKTPAPKTRATRSMLARWVEGDDDD